MLAIGKPKMKQVGLAVAMATLSFAFAPKPAHAIGGGDAAIVAATNAASASRQADDLKDFLKYLEELQGLSADFMSQLESLTSGKGLEQLANSGDLKDLFSGILPGIGSANADQGQTTLCQMGSNPQTCLEDLISQLSSQQNAAAKKQLENQNAQLGSLVSSHEQRLTEVAATGEKMDEIVAAGTSTGATEKQVNQAILAALAEMNKNLMATNATQSQNAIEEARQRDESARIAAQWRVATEQRQALDKSQGSAKGPKVDNTYAVANGSSYWGK